jgi:TRAP-type mannitol/chloroaromatic compound transport system substrate-binding protein
MDRGVIDAFEFNNPTSDSRFGAQDVAKNYMLGSYHQASESFEIMFNKDRFESLDPDLQAILEYGVEAASTANLALAMRQYSDDLQKLIDGGVNVKRTPESILQAQLEAWDKIIPTLEEDEFNKRVLDSQRAWVEKVAFYQLMNAPSYQLAFEHYYPGKIPS